MNITFNIDNRAKFEAWCTHRTFVRPRLGENGEYEIDRHRDLWAAWNAALLNAHSIVSTNPNGMFREHNLNGCACNYPNRQYPNGLCDHCGGVKYTMTRN